MDETLWSLLHSAERVFAHVGARIFWGVAPQGSEMPRLVLTIISGADTPHLSGTDGLWRYRVQIDCYGKDRPMARALSRDVMALLNGYAAAGETGIRGCFIDGSREDFEEAAGRPSRISHDFNIFWRAEYA